MIEFSLAQIPAPQLARASTRQDSKTCDSSAVTASLGSAERPDDCARAAFRPTAAVNDNASACRRSIAPVQRIAVIGCGGAGKTTLANELGRRLDLPVLHIDGHYWQQRPDGEQVESTPEQWRAIHAEMIAGERWVIDGMKLGALPARLEAADTIVFLDLPRWRCLWGVLCRRLCYRGQIRPDIGVYDRINAEFVRWIWLFGRTARPRILDLLSECSCDVVVCTSRREVRSFLQSLARLHARLAA